MHSQTADDLLDCNKTGKQRNVAFPFHFAIIQRAIINKSPDA